MAVIQYQEPAGISPVGDLEAVGRDFGNLEPLCFLDLLLVFSLPLDDDRVAVVDDLELEAPQVDTAMK
jgi:hypothetical protein